MASATNAPCSFCPSAALRASRYFSSTCAACSAKSIEILWLFNWFTLDLLFLFWASPISISLTSLAFVAARSLPSAMIESSKDLRTFSALPPPPPPPPVSVPVGEANSVRLLKSESGRSAPWSRSFFAESRRAFNFLWDSLFSLSSRLAKATPRVSCLSPLIETVFPLYATFSTSASLVWSSDILDSTSATLPSLINILSLFCSLAARKIATPNAAAPAAKATYGFNSAAAFRPIKAFVATIALSFKVKNAALSEPIEAIIAAILPTAKTAKAAAAAWATKSRFFASAINPSLMLGRASSSAGVITSKNSLKACWNSAPTGWSALPISIRILLYATVNLAPADSEDFAIFSAVSEYSPPSWTKNFIRSLRPTSPCCKAFDSSGPVLPDASAILLNVPGNLSAIWLISSAETFPFEKICTSAVTAPSTCSAPPPVAIMAELIFLNASPASATPPPAPFTAAVSRVIPLIATSCGMFNSFVTLAAAPSARLYSPWVPAIPSRAIFSLLILAAYSANPPSCCLSCPTWAPSAAPAKDPPTPPIAPPIAPPRNPSGPPKIPPEIVAPATWAAWPAENLRRLRELFAKALSALSIAFVAKSKFLDAGSSPSRKLTQAALCWFKLAMLPLEALVAWRMSRDTSS